MEELATTINSVASNLNCYFWRLSGDAPNSVCKFLGVEEAQLKVVLRLCKIYTGKKDNFSKKNFENFMLNDDVIPTKEEDQLKEEEEVLGWTLDAAARGVAIMGTAVFVSSELLKLAKEAAGCNADFHGETWNAGGCDQRVYGMRPLSILANIVMVVGLISTALMPLIGSLIDHTPHRRAMGSISAAFMMVVFILLQMIVLQDAWFQAAILQIFIAFSYTVHLCAVYAYLPKLTNNPECMVHYTAQFSSAHNIPAVSDF